MRKNAFLPILKTIASILDRNQIVYEIPYCHIDKETFKYIDIIISNECDIKSLISEIGMVKKSEKNYYRVEKHGIIINLIVCPSDEINFNFNYYNWNFLPFLLRLLAKGLGMDYTVQGLSYKGIHISRNLQKCDKFLGIPFKILYNFNIPSKKELYSLILNSEFYDPEFFTLEKLKEIDPNYEYNLVYYEEFIKICSSSSSNLIEPMVESKLLMLIHSVFSDCKIYENLFRKENI